MKESLAAEIVKMGVEKITFSLDGPDDIHNKIRRGEYPGIGMKGIS